MPSSLTPSPPPNPRPLNFTQDPRDFADILSPRMPFIFDTILANRWYIKFARHLVESDAGTCF